MTPDITDEQAAEIANKQAADRRASELNDLGILFDTQAGRRVLRRILERTGPLRQTFDADSERLSSMRAGERNIGLWILAELVDARPEGVGALIADVQKPNRLDATIS
jgi:hypothetical protein